MTEYGGVERSTATDEVCRLLDELGVEYERTPWSCGAAVWWRDGSGTMWRAHDNEEDELLSFYAYNSVTPEQAIAATLGSCNCTNSERTSDELGRGTCHDAAGKQMAFFACSACGATNEHKHPRFCYECGRKVVDE